jgi:hypothetical protein
VPLRDPSSLDSHHLGWPEIAGFAYPRTVVDVARNHIRKKLGVKTVKTQLFPFFGIFPFSILKDARIVPHQAFHFFEYFLLSTEAI